MSEGFDQHKIDEEERKGLWGAEEGRVTTDYCTQCCDAECCRKIGFIVKPQGAMADLVRVHYGTEIKEIKFVIHHTCPHLTEDNLCDLWHEDPEKDRRPEYCKNYLCTLAKNKRINFDAYPEGGSE